MSLLSVILATYNENPDFLKTCIDSVLSQTYSDFEFIIVMEPGDNTNLDYLKNMTIIDKRIRVLRNVTRLGVAASRNRAILETTGEYIAIVDGDDFYDSKRFEKQIQFLIDNPTISLVGSNIYLVDENNMIIGERIYPENHNEIKKHFLIKMAVANPSIIVRRKELDDVGYFNNALSKAEDFDLWLRFLASNKKMHNLQDKLIYYRTLRNDNKKRGPIHYINYYNTLKKHGKFIWPFYQRVLYLFLFYIISHIPNIVLDYLLNRRIVKRIKWIKRYD